MKISTLLIVLSILIIAVFLTGCATKEIQAAKEAEEDAKDYQQKVESAARKTESTRQQMEDSVAEED